ncbi:Gfo/Idh/MocA family protein [Streptomyces sp. NPDC088785]|uniref:Gfo/Idh/MocA family protein n=1 Tax=Streptomyces sp. NPDC088785 TaxID=3365897 RepID=UPI0037F50912
MTGTPVVKVGVLSFAHVHAGGFARLLAGMDGVEVRAADPDPDPAAPGEVRGAEFAARLGVPYADTYEELFAWGPDKVVVCAENARHRPLVERAAAHGVDVLCEKPLATTPEDGVAMVEACRAAGVRLAVAHPVRFSPAYLAVRDAVRAGTAGEVLAVAAANNGYLPAGRRRWFVEPLLAGGGALIDHTVHVVDLLDDLFEGCPVTSVYAQTNNVLYGARGDVPVETAGLLTLTYANGAVLTLDFSWSQPRHHPAWGGLSMRVVGERAVLEMDAFDQKVFGFDERGRRGVEIPYGVGLDELMMRAFLFGEGDVGVTDGGAGVRALRVVSAAYASAGTGRTVRLP